MTASPTVAHIDPDVLRWARESAGYSSREAADKIGVAKWYLELVEDRGEHLTLREAERAAEVYERPLAALFLPSPPDEEPQELQFRRLPGTPEPPWGYEIQLAARRVTERQQAALEIYEVLEEAPPWTEVSPRFGSIERGSLARLARQLLGVSIEQQREWKQDNYAPLRGWRTAVEELGVLVMQEGPVAVDMMRGFASVSPPEVPAILVNNKDDPRARAFTILHELGHIVLASRGESIGRQAERWCENFAGEVLMPPDLLAETFHSSDAASTIQRVDEVALAFRVTPLAAAVRLARSGLVADKEAGAVIGTMQRGRRSESDGGQGGGTYYVNQVARFGPAYLKLVFSAVDAQAVTLPTASALLEGVKVKYFEPLRERFETRG